MSLEELMADADMSMRTFAAENMSRRTNTGIPVAPKIDVDEVAFDPGNIKLQFRPTAESASQTGI